MAEKHTDLRLLRTLTDVLKEHLSLHYRKMGIEWKTINIFKRTRDLKDGEFVIPMGSAAKIIEQTFPELQDDIQTSLAAIADVDLPISHVDSDKHNLARFHIHRSKAFYNVIRQVETRRERYGQAESEKQGHVLLNMADFQSSPDPAVTLTPAHLRYIFILQHVARLLDAHGHQVEAVPMKRSTQFQKLCSCLQFAHKVPTACTSAATTGSADTVLNRLQQSRYTGSQSGSRSASGVINLKQFIAENGSSVGKGGYDKNLSLVDVFHGGRPSDIVEHVARLEQSHAHTREIKQSRTCVIHLVSEGKAFVQQQADLLWKMAAGDSWQVEQTHLVIGPVTGRSGHPCNKTAEEFVKLRSEQMTDTSVMKYGEEVKGPDWETTLSGMTTASIAFEMLTTASRSPVKLDLSAENRMGVENRAGAFVLYNCARLAMLLKHFQVAVTEGVYPPMPSLEDIKFEHLREQEEWELLFSYIHQFPEVVERCVETLDASPTDIHARIHTHKISIFLVNFSRCLSSYYSRVHILGDGRPHLFPAMFARLYLMQATHQCLQNGLQLLGLQPYSQL